MNESSMHLDDVKKAVEILETRGKPKSVKTIHASDHITIYYEDVDEDVMIEEELDI